jgi:uncharacterized protein DUF1569
MKNLLNPNDCEALQLRINSISSFSEKQWGRMEPNQMIIHLKDQLDIALGHMPAKAQGPVLLHTVIGKYLALYVLPWRKEKVRTPLEMDADLKGRVVTNFESDKHLLLTRMKEFVDATSYSAHPFFGNLNRKDWGRLAWKHINHHLLQFGA